ncbi:TPA: excalibur calcium-binding domain-containing protein [Vibrio parahaemolyticus]
MYDGRAASVNYLQRAPHRVKYKCSTLTRAMAQSLYQAGHTYLDRDSDGKPCESKSLSELYSNSFGSSNVKGSSCHYVRGYTRKDGTYVRGHTRCR